MSSIRAILHTDSIHALHNEITGRQSTIFFPTIARQLPRTGTISEGERGDAVVARGVRSSEVEMEPLKDEINGVTFSKNQLRIRGQCVWITGLGGWGMGGLGGVRLAEVASLADPWWEDDGPWAWFNYPTPGCGRGADGGRRMEVEKEGMRGPMLLCFERLCKDM